MTKLKIFLDGTEIAQVNEQYAESFINNLEFEVETPINSEDWSVEGEVHLTSMVEKRAHVFADGRILISTGHADFDSIHGDWIGAGYEEDSIEYLVTQALEHSSDEIDDEFFEKIISAAQEMDK